MYPHRTLRSSKSFNLGHTSIIKEVDEEDGEHSHCGSITSKNSPPKSMAQNQRPPIRTIRRMRSYTLGSNSSSNNYGTNYSNNGNGRPNLSPQLRRRASTLSFQALLGFYLERESFANSSSASSYYSFGSNSSSTSSSNSSSTNSSPSTSPPCSDSEEPPDSETHANNPLSPRIRKKLSQRDRNNEMEYLLKRKSLQLSRQSSLGSGSGTHSYGEPPTPTTIMSRHNSIVGMQNMISGDPNLPTSNQAPTLLLRQTIKNLAKALRSNCDKILDLSQPFVIDAIDLWRTSEGINIVLTNNPNSPPEDQEQMTKDDFEYNALFLSDFFEHTPSLCISTNSSGGNTTIPGNLDLTLFRSLQYLELRNLPPHMVAGLNTIRNKLRKLKLSRCIDSLSEIFTVPFVSAEILSSPMPITHICTPNLITSIWRELKEIDVSFNRIEILETKPLECTPSVEILNCSRNQIHTVEPQFSRLLNSLTVLNLNYNQLKSLPPLPPTLKVLLLSNNYISSLGVNGGKGNNNGGCGCFSVKNLECLDLSQNIISDGSELEALSNLSNLKSLGLEGNPLSYSGKYREIICFNLHRLVLLNKNFTLDGKKLGSSEVRAALEWIKHRRPRPMVLLPNFQSTPSSSSTTQQPQIPNSLTQSFDSSRSSSLINRKKARIREIVILDSDEGDAKSTSSPDRESEREQRPTSASKSRNSNSNIRGRVDLTQAIQEKRAAYELIREKYGEDNWLLRQGGVEVSRLMYPNKIIGIGGIPITPGNESGPGVGPVAGSLSSMTHYYSALQDLEGGNPMAMGSAAAEAKNSDSDESIKPVNEYESANGDREDDHDIFYPCNTSTSFNNHEDERFVEPEGQTCQKFRTFQSGVLYHFIVLDHFLYEVDPSDKNLILNKWDLKGLKSVTEGKRSAETETAEFTLQFETRRKSGREKSFIMPIGDYSKFESAISPFLQLKALQEFADGYQCIKCNSQFSKGQALSKILQVPGHGRNTGPKEVPICPVGDCGSEYLVPLDSIPLPNNESLQLEKAVGEVQATNNNNNSKRSSFWDPIRTSTPLSGFFGARSLPSTNCMPTSGVIAGKNSTSPPSSIGSASSKPSSSNSSIHPVVPVPEKSNKTKLKRTTNVNNNNNHKSDSDIETLSRHSNDNENDDSSSIEVCVSGASGASSSSDASAVVVVEEGLEVDIPILPAGGVRMSDSTSSIGTGSSSICTQYENLQPISHQMQSSLTSNSSTKTLVGTSGSGSSSLIAPTAIPIKYDYEDYHRIDHRLQLYADLNVFKHPDERCLLLTKIMLIGSSGSFLAILIISNKKVYFYKIVAAENDNPDTWLQKLYNFPLSKLTKLDVLIGRHGVGMEFTPKSSYFALLFRDSGRTSNFIEFFLAEVCGEMESPCLVQDFSQSQKQLMSPTSPIAYFGVLRYAFCGGETGDKTYAIASVVLTSDELIIVGDLSWLVNKASQTVSVKHVRTLATLKQVESLEVDPTFLRLVYELNPETVLKWELLFETENEKSSFINCLESSIKSHDDSGHGTATTTGPRVPFISLSQPLEI